MTGKRKRDGAVTINLHLYDRNLMNNMAKAKKETRSELISRLLHREARERGLNPQPTFYPSASVKKTPN